MTVKENRVDGEEEEAYTMKMLLKTKALMWPLAVAVMLQIIQQLSGINAVSLSGTVVMVEYQTIICFHLCTELPYKCCCIS